MIVLYLYHKTKTNRLEKEKAEYELNLQKAKDLLKKLESDLEVLKTDKKSKAKEMILCLLEFVSIHDRDFYYFLEVDYSDLSIFQKLFLVVCDLLKKDDLAVCKMFSLNKESLYNKRRRIKSKKIE